MRLVSVTVKPFLKWAGGKTQLLPRLMEKFPAELKIGATKRYVEPFLGGGAVFFHIAQLFAVQEFRLSDVNPEVVLCYQTVKQDVKNLTCRLEEMQRHYRQLTASRQEEMFYEIRAQLNANCPQFDFDNYSQAWVERAAQIIFLNHTCFNGLFRVNAKGLFNVPFGKYRNPALYEKNNLAEIAAILQDATILRGDFASCENFVDAATFCYFDPPYRPLNKTASFTSYSSQDFNDTCQRRLAAFFRRLDGTGAKLMLSNSDPKNVNPNDNFFEHLYYGFNISAVKALRAINSKGSKRGAVSELVITNY